MMIEFNFKTTLLKLESVLEQVDLLKKKYPNVTIYIEVQSD